MSSKGFIRRRTRLVVIIAVLIALAFLFSPTSDQSYDEQTGSSTSDRASSPGSSSSSSGLQGALVQNGLNRLRGAGLLGGGVGRHRSDFRPREDNGFKCDRCLSDPERCHVYGSRNVDLSRAWDGSGARINRVLQKVMRGEKIKTAALGGSISIGAGCDCDAWHVLVGDWFNSTWPHPDFAHINGAVGARGSDYFKFCHKEHIDTDADLVLIETSVNDFRMGDPAFENFETLLRAVLNYPSKPAVIVLQTMKLDGIIATGGDSQLSLAHYYDVPVISTRNWMLPMMMRNGDKLKEFYNYDIIDHETGKLRPNKDLLHPNAKGHRMMADMIIMYLTQQACYLDQKRPSIPPSASPNIPQPSDHYPMDELPRMRLNRQFETSGREPEASPQCASMDSARSPLVPLLSETKGFSLWEMPGTNGRKKFWRGEKPGDMITFEVELVTGNLNAYYLRSAKHGMGSVDCWLDDDKSQLKRLNGYWSDPQTVGDYMTLFDGIPGLRPGKHQLHCQITESTPNPDQNSHTFMFIGLFSV